jgi:SAM-dependent methyltransferase
MLDLQFTGACSIGRMRTRAASDEQFEYWNGDEAAHWLAYEARYEALLASFTDHLLRAAEISSVDAVLDIGCGCGATTRAAGRLAGGGCALGVDLSERLLRRAEERTREEGLTNVRFEHADVQVHTLPDRGFDVAISRFGTMFFADPVTAFANVGRALRSGGRVAFVCWAGALDNEWIAVPGAAAAQHVALPSSGDPGSPGPFSLADRDRLLAVLGAAGLMGAEVEAVTEPLLVGSDLADTVEFFKATGFGQTLLRGADEATVSRVTEAIAAALEPRLSQEGIRLGSKAWLATAHLVA